MYMGTDTCAFVVGIVSHMLRVAALVAAVAFAVTTALVVAIVAIAAVAITTAEAMFAQ